MNNDTSVQSNDFDCNTVIDIKTKGEYPSCALSNYAAHSFTMDDVACSSMEGFLQSLKFSSPQEQERVCKLTGKEAKERGQQIDWKTSQQIYWNGTTIDRHCEDYQKLLTRAYDALYESETFREALRASIGKTLAHSHGDNDPQQTVLTTNEFLGQLNRLRKKLENEMYRQKLNQFRERFSTATEDELKDAFDDLLTGTYEQLCKLNYVMSVLLHCSKLEEMAEKLMRRWDSPANPNVEKWSVKYSPVCYEGLMYKSHNDDDCDETDDDDDYDDYDDSNIPYLYFSVNFDCFDEESPLIAFQDSDGNERGLLGFVFLRSITIHGDRYKLFEANRETAKDNKGILLSDSCGEFSIHIGHYVDSQLRTLYNDEFCYK